MGFLDKAKAAAEQAAAKADPVAARQRRCTVAAMPEPGAKRAARLGNRRARHGQSVVHPFVTAIFSNAMSVVA